MADLIKNLTTIGIKEEVTEGTYVAPSTSTDFFQPLEDGFESSLTREQLDRTVLTSGLSDAIPRQGMREAAAAYPVEFRASGIEGAETDFDLLLQGAFGNRRQEASRFTTGTTHTSTVLNGTAMSGTFAVGDPIVILESGAHHIAICTAVDSTTLTYSPAFPSGTPSDAVEIAKFTTYYPADTGHKALSITEYLDSGSDIIERRNIGMKVSGLSIENFTTGQLANMAFALGGLNHEEVAGSVLPATPSYDSGLPPVILNACLYQDGVALPYNEFALSLENELAFKTDACDENGRVGSRVVNRTVSGSFNPYKDDAAVDQFDKFNGTTSYSLIITAHTPSSTAGEVELGSVVTLYMPNCITVEKPTGDVNGIITDAISFKATGGPAGDQDEIYLGMV